LGTTRLTSLLSIDSPEAAVARESIPHLVVTGGCECGCRSFNVRDVRFRRSASGGNFHLSNGRTPDGSHGFFLLLDARGRPYSVDHLDGAGLPSPDPATLIVTSPADGPAVPET
jgi:hypothetical protein